MNATFLRSMASRAAWVLSITACLWMATSARVTIAQQNPPGDGGLKVSPMPHRPNFHVISGAGGNIVMQVGIDGVVLVDTGATPMANAVLAVIKQVTDQPIRYIINTGADPDHVGGNEVLAKAGLSLFVRPGDPVSGTIAANEGNSGAAAIVGREGVVQRMSGAIGGEAAYPAVGWPTEPFSLDRKELFLNREAIVVYAAPAAHSDSDSMAFFRSSDVIAAGDVFDFRRFPVIDLGRGGSINGEIAALNKILEIAIPSIPMPWLEHGGTLVIPGHGRPGEEAEVLEYRDMVTIVRDRVQDMMKRGLTVEQVKAANPTAGYRRRFGTDSGPWTTDMFVEAVYKSLAQKP